MKERDLRTKRVIRIMLLLLGQPGRYTRKGITEKFNIARSTFVKDIDLLKSINIDVNYNEHNHTYSILPDGSFDELRYLIPLTKKDQLMITNAISHHFNSREANQLKSKFNSLYDFQRLGLRALRKPELEKLDRLRAAQNEKKRVTLEAYRSNSNETRDREVEPFYIDTTNGMLQAYDINGQDSRHFKLSRIKRVTLTDQEWGYETKHYRKMTDVFRIADNDLIMVHLELDTYAYNALIDSYPQAKAKTEHGNQKNTYNFQSEVNVKFMGLTNFILGNRGHVKILGPQKLKEHIKQEAQRIIEQLEEENNNLY